jgi:hypothetical protein
MSNFGMKQNPTKKVSGKLKKERTVDLNRMYRQSQKSVKKTPKNVSYKTPDVELNSTILLIISFIFILGALLN